MLLTSSCGVRLVVAELWSQLCLVEDLLEAELPGL
jgi:hypothetical protein